MRESPMRPVTPAKRLGLPANDTGGANQGNFILRKGAGELWKPAWDGSPTTVRVFPGLNPENPTEFEPWRFNTSEDGLGQWYWPITVIQNLGNPGKTFVLYDPQDAAYDPQTNPVWMLRNAIDRAVRDRTDRSGWAGMLKGGAGRGAMLDRPRDCILIQCAIMSYKNKLYAPPRGGGAPGTDNTVFFLLTPSARQAMMEAMNTRIEGYRGDPDHVAGHYLHGDPIDLDGGQYLTFYKLGHDPREQVRARQAATSFGQQARGTGPGARSDDDPIGFGCFLTPEFNEMPARLREVESVVRAHVKPFWESVRVEPESVQVRWIEEGFQKEADAVVYALDEAYGQYLRPEYRERGLQMLGRGRPVQGGWDQKAGQAPAAGGWGGAPAATPSGGGFGGSAVPRQPGSGPYGPPAQASRPAGGWGAPAPQAPDDQASEYAGSEGEQPSLEEQAVQVFGGVYGNPPPPPPPQPQPPQGVFGRQPQRTPTPDVPAPGTAIPDHASHVSAAPVPPSTGAPAVAQNEVNAALERARQKAAQKKNSSGGGQR